MSCGYCLDNSVKMKYECLICGDRFCTKECAIKHLWSMPEYATEKEFNEMMKEL